jgi:predicted protein tyrosine phosphatase
MIKYQKIDYLNDPIISICCPNERPKELLKRENIFTLDFHDVFSDMAEYKTPRKSDIKQVLDWAKDKDGIIIHCLAGVSRSSAIGFGLLIQEGMKPIDALEEILEIRKIAYPNKLIVKYVFELFNLQEDQYDKIYDHIEKIHPKDKILI